MALRFLLPFDNFKLRTELTMAEVVTRITNDIEPRKTFRLTVFYNKPTKPYEGEIVGTSFKIRRIIRYRNSFLPVIMADISTGLDKTEVTIRMRPAIAVLIFSFIWLGAVGLACIGISIAAIRNMQHVIQHGFSSGMVIPYIMFVFGYLLILIGYRPEAKKSKDFLKSVLEADESD